jgi:hypothetical protein
MLSPSTSKGAQRQGARDVHTHIQILLNYQREKRDLQTLKEPRGGKFKRTKSISLWWVLWSDIKSVHQSEPALTADASAEYSPPGGDLPHWSWCRGKDFSCLFATTGPASFAIPQIAVTSTAMYTQLKCCAPALSTLGSRQRKRKSARKRQPRVINGKRIALDGL